MSKKSKACKAETQFRVKAVMPLKSEMFGRVIRKGRNVVKKITEDSNVSMSLGKWFKSSGKGREDSAFESFCSPMYRPHLWCNYPKSCINKLYVAYHRILKILLVFFQNMTVTN